MFKNNVETFEEFKKLMDYQAKGLKLVNDCIGEHQKASSKLSIDYLNMCRKKEKSGKSASHSGRKNWSMGRQF